MNKVKLTKNKKGEITGVEINEKISEKELINIYIKPEINKALKAQRQEIIDEIKEIGGNCYKCGKWIPDCILGDACICKKDCSKNEQP